jgi:hypothetical protein
VKTTLVGLGVFLINLDEPGEQRFLKCKIAVEVEKFLLDKGLEADAIRKVAATFYTMMLRRKSNTDK